MTTEQLAALFHEGFRAIGVAPRQDTINQFVVYIRELRQWNAKINLTGHTREQEMVGNLFVDSLAGIRVVGMERLSSVLDIGSGAGFPGIPIHIFSPQRETTLLEPNLKKVAFLHHIIGLLGLHNVRVESKNIEQVSKQNEFHGKFDWVFMKALRLSVGLSYVSPILSALGKCVVWRAHPLPPALNPPAFSVVKEISYELPFGLGHRLLSILERSQ